MHYLHVYLLLCFKNVDHAKSTAKKAAQNINKWRNTSRSRYVYLHRSSSKQGRYIGERYKRPRLGDYTTG